MKNIVSLLYVLGVVTAEIDWSSVTERNINIDIRPLPLAISEYANRITGGQEARPHQFPYQAGLILTVPGNDRKGFCGGTLISENYVLTAAHCVDKMETIEVILGGHRIKEYENTQVRMNCTEFIVHEDWSPTWMRNDIALIKLPELVQLNDNIQPIHLPSKSENRKFEGHIVTVTGWGKDSDDSDGISPVLRHVQTTIISNPTCFLSFPFLISKTHICTSGENGKSSCDGDSGGPLTTEENDRTFLIGLVSFGRNTGCEKGYPAVFTRLTSFLTWIEQHSDVRIQ
ncbi:uncharacterized protein CBL_00302 [Carabus blaptoides fortunei]